MQNDRCALGHSIKFFVQHYFPASINLIMELRHVCIFHQLFENDFRMDDVHQRRAPKRLLEFAVNLELSGALAAAAAFCRPVYYFFCVASTLGFLLLLLLFFFVYSNCDVKTLSPGKWQRRVLRSGFFRSFVNRKVYSPEINVTGERATRQ